MPTPANTYEAIAQAAEALLAQGQEPTLVALQERIGGNASAIKRHLDGWPAQRPAMQVIENPPNLAEQAGIIAILRTELAEQQSQIAMLQTALTEASTQARILEQHITWLTNELVQLRSEFTSLKRA